MKSIWGNTVALDSYPALDEDISTNVLVIGGGICGILCAYNLVIEGLNVILVEQNKIAKQKTNKTTAVATILQDNLYSEMLNKVGFNKTKLFLDANLKAIQEYKRLSLKYDFDLENCPSYKYTSSEFTKLKDEYEALKKLGIKCQVKKYNDIKAIEVNNQVQFNPLKLIKNLSQVLKIYENTKIIKIKNNIAYTLNNKIYAEHIIIATGYPFLKFKGHFFTKLYQKKSYVLATDNKNFDKINGVGINSNEIYFRTYKDFLLIGGNDSITGKNKTGFRPLYKFLKENFNNQLIYNQWINQDCHTLDYFPYVGVINKFNKHIYVSTGFNLWGMTGAMISSFVIKDIILNRKNNLIELLKPNRHLPISNRIKLLKNTFTNFFKIKTPRCSHLGCALNYNESEKCYECSCHGSKFNKNGKIIEGPANKNL